jgi:exo-1,4-beta-D-glucosaminidase
VPANLYSGTDKILFVDLSLTNSAGQTVSRNFYWVPTKTTEFDWAKSSPHGTLATHYEDLTELANLPPSKILSSASIDDTPDGSILSVHLDNQSDALAFQVHAAVQTPQGDLVAPVLWSDNWIEVVPGESRTLAARLPKGLSAPFVVEISGWNISPETITPHAHR